jgi:hypothetical protein
MKQKLWIMWAVMAISGVIAGLANSRIGMYSFGLVGAIAGWIAFFLPRPGE